jgi:transposase InsO family protein
MSDSWEIAAFRFEMISPLLDDKLTETQKRRIIRDRTRRAVQWPCSPDKKPIGRSTLFRWLKDYREKGFLGLMSKVRKDKGVARTDRSEQVNYALGLLYEEPERSLTQLMVYLELEFGQLSLSRSTLSRDLHAHPAFTGILRRRKAGDKKLRDLYETDQPHEIWQLDAKGPFPVTLINGQTIRVHVLSILDDFSRCILAAIIAPAENIEAAVRVFRLAASKWGIALRMQFDRASAYDSVVFRTGLAFLGVHRNRVKSRNPEAQGKVEAYHRSLKKWFVKELPHQQVVDIQHLEALLQATIALVYNRHYHREIKMTPEQALARRISTRRVGADQLAQAFKISTRAKSHPKTGQVNLPNGLFRVPARFAGKRCDFRYDPVNKEDAALIIDDTHRIPLEPFTKKRPFDFQKTEQKRGTGQLQKLVDIWQGHHRPNAQPGFGLPEIFREFSRLLQRSVPIDQHEAAAIESFYRKNGPLPAQSFRQAIDKTAQALGANRALRAYLQYLERLVQAQKNNPYPKEQPL